MQQWADRRRSYNSSVYKNNWATLCLKSVLPLKRWWTTVTSTSPTTSATRGRGLTFNGCLACPPSQLLSILHKMIIKMILKNVQFYSRTKYSFFNFHLKCIPWLNKNILLLNKGGFSSSLSLLLLLIKVHHWPNSKYVVINFTNLIYCILLHWIRSISTALIWNKHLTCVLCVACSTREIQNLCNNTKLGRKNYVKIQGFKEFICQSTHVKNMRRNEICYLNNKRENA